jgi:hypothetical protein
MASIFIGALLARELKNLESFEARLGGVSERGERIPISSNMRGLNLLLT